MRVEMRKQIARLTSNILSPPVTATISILLVLTVLLDNEERPVKPL
ncbi:unnamed protein product, partial [marine sediment metagenome]